MRTHSGGRLRRLLPLAVGTLVLVCGALQGWAGRPELLGDDIAYLDVSHLLRAGEWKEALNPVWSVGYPALLAGVRPLFALGIHGELKAVFALNMTIFLGAWLAFRCFLRTAKGFAGARLTGYGNEGNDTRLRATEEVSAAAIFLCASVCLGNVSSVGPDGLVACLFFLASALLLRFALLPAVGRGLKLGAVLGLGFVAKAIFLPLGVIFIGVALLPLRRSLTRRVAWSIPGAMLVFLLPYGAGLSWALGRPTLGESGSLNYAYHVNRLPHWMGWQGGPAGMGVPLHPVRLLRERPAVFGFGEPFHVTYPPQFELHYWYDGYSHFFSAGNALRAIAMNLHALEGVLHENWRISLGVLAVSALALFRLRPLRGLRPVWQAVLPAVLGIGLYVQVHLEGRYVAPFLAVLAMLPLLMAERLLSRKLRMVLAVAVCGCAAGDLAGSLRPAWRGMRQGVETSEPWVVARYLTASGLTPGERVATVTTLNEIRCTWAYAAGLHVVAGIGNDAYDPRERQRDFDRFWTDAATQADVLRLMREQGAVAVVAPHGPEGVRLPAAGWKQVPGAQAWVLHLPEGTLP